VHLPLVPIAAISLANSSVAAKLGQSARSLELGITATYIRNRNDDSWKKRVDASFQDPFGLDLTDNVYKRPRWTKVELDRIYKEEGVDPLDYKATRTVKVNRYKEH
jgi:hypothetical protein